MEELVSIIIPAYNHGKYIEQTLMSIINQTYSNIELIIINDGSTDNTNFRILHMDKKLKERFVRYIYVNKINEGICKALNEGLSLAKGQYIIPFSSDDLMFSRRVEKQVEFFKNHDDYGMVYTDMYVFKTQDYISLYRPHILYENCWKYSNAIPFKEGYVLDWMLAHMIYVPTPSICIKRECYNKLGLYDENMPCEDLDMFIRIAKYFKIGCIKECLTIKRYHGTNTGIRPDIARKCILAMKEKYITSPMLTSEQRTLLFNTLDDWAVTLSKLNRREFNE